MTSAVRIVSPAAVRNGPALSVLLVRLARDLPGLTVLTETAAGAVLVDGAPHRGLSYVRRDAPALAPGEIALPMAALAAPSPADGRPLAAEAISIGYAGRPEPFFADVCRVLAPPLLALLHRGVALEAHGQNTLIALRGGRPARLFYRDLGGVRVSPARLARHGIEAPRLHGDLGTDDPHALRTKLFAAVFSTVLSELVAVLGREYGVAAPALWRQAAGTVRTVYAGLPHDADARSDAAALAGPTLPLKAMTAMRLAADPLQDLWISVPNPMAA
jgi:siderophore synthetase component